MDKESAEIAGFLISYVAGIVVLGVMAAAKNRNYMGWALIGGLFCFPCLIALAFLPTLCPKCKRPLLAAEWSRRECPTCGSLDDSAPTSEKAQAMLQKATKLEIQGQVRQAVVLYQDVIETYPGTQAANDAHKSLDSLREQLG